jgi:hypothetical protein
MEGRLSNGTVRVTIVFLSKCYHLQKRSGLKFLVIYLKAQNVNLMQALAGTAGKDISNLGCRFARKRGSKLPQIIPILHRVHIRNGKVYYIKLWTTLFNLYRVLSFPGLLDLSTIVDPSSFRQDLFYQISVFALTFWKLLLKQTDDKWLRLALRDKLKALKELQVRPFGIATSSPSFAGMISSSYMGVLSSIFLWKSSSNLPYLYDYLKSTGNISFIRFIETGVKISSWPKEFISKCKTLGGLGLKPEPAGKVRVFALVDCVTQWVMDPLHKRLFTILGKIPQDGTFDQIKPLKALLHKNKSLYSLDLSAATDRLPIVLQMIVLSPLVGANFARLWSIMLIGRPYSLPKSASEFLSMKDKQKNLKQLYYGAGQPMGALTSWAMLAVTHHFIVQFAAFLVCGKIRWFEDYAILGDDVVIADGPIAHKYLEIMSWLGVKVGIHKSLLSPSGNSLEFAKRYFYNKKDCSAIPLKEVYAGTVSISASIELMRKYKTSLSQILAFNHFGYKSLSKITNPLRKLSGRMRAIILSSLFPVDWTPEAFKDFLSIRSLVQRVPVRESVFQGLTDSYVSLIRKQISKLDNSMSLLRYLVTVDRTRAHYGIISFDQDPRICSLLRPYSKDHNLDLRDMPISNELYSYVILINEFVYRNQYMDTLLKVRELVALINEVDSLSKIDLFETILSKLVSIENDLSLLPFVERDQRRIVQVTKSSVSRFIRLWKSSNLGVKLK